MRTDRQRLKGSEKSAGSVPVHEESAPAGDGNLKNDFLDVTALIRSIQRAEGNPDCFLKGEEDCTRLDCAWRPYCLKSHRTF